jgi:excisionase family DNA binding protein
VSGSVPENEAGVTLESGSEPLWTAEDVSAFLRVSLSMVYKLRRAGKLRAVPVGSLYRFNPAHVRAFARGELGPSARTVVSLTGRR